jgi:hypothetical protein
MGPRLLPTLRTPMILLAVVNLVILGKRLWPWQQVLQLPGDGTTGIDPAITLLGYIGLVFWIAGNPSEPVKRALSTGAMLGVLAGFLLVAHILLPHVCCSAGFAAALLPHLVQVGLLTVSGILWGIAGLRGLRATRDVSIGTLAGVWSAMVSCLMAATAVLVEMSLAVSPPLTQDPWKQYEALAIGPATTQALVNSLNSATAFLLVGPLVGAALGLVFAFFGNFEEGPEPAALR